MKKINLFRKRLYFRYVLYKYSFNTNSNSYSVHKILKVTKWPEL